jgi:arabinan endo-1,5-alpha-L-arabinosidase
MKYFIILLFLFLSLQLHAQEYQKDISVHDPVMIKEGKTFYLFCTGFGINVWSSPDMKSWKKLSAVFPKAPEWAIKEIPNFKGHIWAPDIFLSKGIYYLYYSVSAFGKNTSAIGVATNTTLNPESKGYKWTDHGKVIQSVPGKTNWNAIDPNVIRDEKGIPWMVFGSFWEGIKLLKLKQNLLGVNDEEKGLLTIASRKSDPAAANPPAVDGNPADAGGNAIEAPFLFKKNKYYYLFCSIDYCCKGPQSTYKMIVGRSKCITGPYLDQEGRSLASGGGTLLLQGNEKWYGTGHNAVCHFGNTDYLVFHGYDASDKGISKLRIEKLSWEKGWPLVKRLYR